MKNSVFKVICINLLVFIFAFEIGGIFVFSIQNGKLTLAADNLPKSPLYDQASDCFANDSISLSTYLATTYSNSGCGPADVNSYGLRGLEPGVFKETGHFTLLIVGSSVASLLGSVAGYENGRSYLETYLNKNWNSPTGLPFRIISGGAPETSAPTSFIAASMFMNRADEVIAVEGFNEHVRINEQTELEEPSAIWSRLAKASEYPFLYFANRRGSEGLYKLNNSIFRQSFLAQFIFGALSYLGQPYVSISTEKRLYPGYKNLAAAAAKQRILSNFRRYLSYINVLASSENKKFTFFIQPSAYRFKKLTPEEESDVRKNHEQTLDALSSISEYFLSQKFSFPVESLEHIYETDTDRIYTDFVHPNKKGLEKMAEIIAARLANRNHWIKK